MSDDKIKDLITSNNPFEETIKNAIVSEAKKAMWNMVEFKEIQMMYACALKEIQTKFEILNVEFNVKYKRNPISKIETRLKRNESIIKKLIKKNIPISFENIQENINDFAGIRIVCTYIDDIYLLANALLKQDDIKLISKKDYITNPKPNGYRSLHLLIDIPVFLVDKKKNVKVEVQIRTIAMDFWASLEHQIKYKKELANNDMVIEEFKRCATLISQTDEKMLELRKEVEEAEDVLDEDEQLKERMRKIDVSIF